MRHLAPKANLLLFESATRRGRRRRRTTTFKLTERDARVENRKEAVLLAVWKGHWLGKLRRMY